MLSPPRSRCRPTATRRRSSAPRASSAARMSVRSVGAPPHVTDEHRRPTAVTGERGERLGSMAREVVVERGLRLLEQPHRQPACAAARSVSSRATGSNDAGTVRMTTCCASGVAGCSASHASRTCSRTRALAATGDTRGSGSSGSSPQGRIAAVRSTAAWASQLLAEVNRAARHLATAAARVLPDDPGRPPQRSEHGSSADGAKRQEGSSGRGSAVWGETSCGIGTPRGLGRRPGRGRGRRPPPCARCRGRCRRRASSPSPLRPRRARPAR
jgi:hypothetical protein